MKTPPQGIEIARSVPSVGLVMLPISVAPQLWSWFSMRADGESLFALVKKTFSDFEGELYDMDSGSAMFIYLLGDDGPRTWSVRGTLTNPKTNLKTFVDGFAGDLMDRRPGPQSVLVVKDSTWDAAPPTTDDYPGVKKMGELTWA